MTTSPGRKHAVPGPASDQPPVPEPTFAQRARTLVYLGRMGSLSTLSRKQPGFPFGSVMPYGMDDQGRPIFLISTMAMHTQNLQADARASLLVTQEGTDGEPLGASRITLLGSVLPVPDSEETKARELYLARHANSKYWVDFEDFSFYRMDVVDVYYVGGFGVMGWVSASDYERSRPDPLADSMAEIIELKRIILRTAKARDEYRDNYFRIHGDYMDFKYPGSRTTTLTCATIASDIKAHGTALKSLVNMLEREQKS